MVVDMPAVEGVEGKAVGFGILGLEVAAEVLGGHMGQGVALAAGMVVVEGDTQVVVDGGHKLAEPAAAEAIGESEELDEVAALAIEERQVQLAADKVGEYAAVPDNLELGRILELDRLAGHTAERQLLAVEAEAEEEAVRSQHQRIQEEEHIG